MRDGKLRRGSPVDPSFVMSDGRAFENFDGFRQLVCEDVRPIARNFAGQLLTYGTGHSIEFADRDELDRIVEIAAEDDFGLRSILYAVVTSPLFLSK